VAIVGISPKAVFPLYNMAIPASDGTAQNRQSAETIAVINSHVGAHDFLARINGPFPEKDIFRVDTP
jgi:hypothetical protein